jgi:glycopeptide antibiotics resistance protein
MNFAYYMPLGVLGELARWPGRTTVLTAAALSAVTEAIQVFSRDRYPSVTDVILNTAGALAGVALIKILRRSTTGRSPSPQRETQA